MMGGSCLCVFAMRLISILNQCYHFPGFVNVVARLCEHTKIFPNAMIDAAKWLRARKL